MTTFTENQFEHQTPVNMFFSQQEIKKNVLPKDDVSTSYIIFQNNELHTKYEEAKLQISELTNEKEDQEDEIDSLTKTRLCLQGYVKNEHIIATNWKEIAKLYKSTLNEYNKYWNTCYIINIMFILVISIIQNNEVRITIMCMYSTINIYVAYSINKNLTNQWFYNETIKNEISEIDNLDKSNNYIDDLIDNM